MAEDKKPRSNKPIKSWFITFPQSGDVSLSQFLDVFMVYPVQYYKLVKELHEDGNPHIHMILQFKGKRTFSAMLGRLKEKFPFDWKRIKIETLRSKTDADIYLSKDCKEKLEGGDYKEREKKVKPMPVWLEREFSDEGYYVELEETKMADDKYTHRYNRLREQDNSIKWCKLKHDLFMTNEFPAWWLRYWCRGKILKKK